MKYSDGEVNIGGESWRLEKVHRLSRRAFVYQCEKCPEEAHSPAEWFLSRSDDDGHYEFFACDDCLNRLTADTKGTTNERQ